MSQRLTGLMDSYYSLGNESTSKPAVSTEEFSDFYQMHTIELKSFADRLNKDAAFLEKELAQIRLRNYVILAEETDRVALLNWIENEGTKISNLSCFSGAVDRLGKNKLILTPAACNSVLTLSILERLEAFMETPRKIRVLFEQGNVAGAIEKIKSVVKHRSSLCRFAATKNVLTEIHSFTHELVLIELDKLKHDFSSFPHSIIVPLVSVLPREDAATARSHCISASVECLKNSLNSLVETDGIMLDLETFTQQADQLIDDSMNSLRWTWVEAVPAIDAAEKDLRSSLIPQMIARKLENFDINDLDETGFSRIFTDKSNPSHSQVEEQAWINTLLPIFKNPSSFEKSRLASTAAAVSSVFADRALSKKGIFESEIGLFASAVGKCLEQLLKENSSDKWWIADLMRFEKLFTEKSVPNLKRLVSDLMVEEVESRYEVESSRLWEVFVDRAVEEHCKKCEETGIVSSSKTFMDKLAKHLPDLLGSADPPIARRYLYILCRGFEKLSPIDDETAAAILEVFPFAEVRMVLGR